MARWVHNAKALREDVGNGALIGLGAPLAHHPHSATDPLAALAAQLARVEAKIDALVRAREGGERRVAPLSYREAGRLLGIDRNKIPALVKRGVLRAVPWGRGQRIPRAEVERLAREGYAPSSAKRPACRKPPGPTPAEVKAQLDEF